MIIWNLCSKNMIYYALCLILIVNSLSLYLQNKFNGMVFDGSRNIQKRTVSANEILANFDLRIVLACWISFPMDQLL